MPPLPVIPPSQPPPAADAGAGTTPALEYSTQPRGSRITLERHADGMTIAYVPRGSGAEGVAAGVLVCLMACITAVAGARLLEFRGEGIPIAAEVFVLAAVWARIIFLIVQRLRHARSPTVLTVTADALTIIRPSPKGPVRSQYPPGWVCQVHAESIGTGLNLRPLGVLRIKMPDVDVELLRNHSLAEVQWVARALREARSIGGVS